jgi:NADH:ubiquinone oxidoreductase subunit 5 (subunit L)/multisubunit Na+/H+ antiporter MnhA subunit
MEITPLLMVGIPVLSCVIALILGRFSRRVCEIFSILSAIVSMILTLSLVPTVLSGRAVVWEFMWIPSLRTPFSIRIDGLSLLISFIATFVGLFCIIYSTQYLKKGEAVGRYYFWMFLFIGSMVALSSSDNIVVLFIFWELVALCSYSLIAFWKEKPSALRAALKTILTVEFGGASLLLGILLLVSSVGSTSISSILGSLKLINPSELSLISLLFLIGAITKSVQTPFFTWLPDAMEAPTPVSALLHAAAMVKAGVFLLARFWPLFSLTAAWSGVVLIIGVATMFIGVMYTFKENNLKRFLAYSTISQIGYMVTGIGLGSVFGIAAGLLHLVNHAFFKSLLFLCAGSVERQTGTVDMNRLGGLFKRMPVTTMSFLIGAASISGIPPFNGFVSKWMIYMAGVELAQPLALTAGIVAMFVSSLTLASFMKAIHSGFFGQAPKELEKVQDCPSLMKIPMIVFAGMCILFGVLPSIPLSLVIPSVSASLSIKEIELSSLLRLFIMRETLWISATSMLAAGLVLGYLIYLAARKKPSLLPMRVEIFTGGEELSSFSPEQIHLSSDHFYLTTIKTPFSSFFAATDFDKLYVKFFEGIINLGEMLSRSRRTPLVIMALLILLLISVLLTLLGWLI